MSVIQIHQQIRKKKISSAILLLIVILGLIAGSIFLEKEETFVEEEITNLPFYGLAANLTLPNINGGIYNLSADAGIIRLVAFMYTKCPGEEGCSLVTLKMAQIYSSLLQAGILNQTRLVSVDFDYINDTMIDLKEYARLYTQDTDRWQFLLGDENQTKKALDDWNFGVDINNQSQLLDLSHGDHENADPYAHALIVYVIGKRGYIRYNLIGDLWSPQKAFDVIEFLVNEA